MFLNDHLYVINTFQVRHSLWHPLNLVAHERAPHNCRVPRNNSNNHYRSHKSCYSRDYEDDDDDHRVNHTLGRDLSGPARALRSSVVSRSRERKRHAECAQRVPSERAALHNVPRFIRAVVIDRIYCYTPPSPPQPVRLFSSTR